jgi:hypothetical protein
MPAAVINLRLRRFIRAVVVICVLIELLLVYLDHTVNYSYGTEIGSIRRLFNITREDGLPSWFGVTITTLAALTLWLIYVVENYLGSGKWIRRGWLVLALFFSYMAMDDGSDMHERIGTAFKEIHARETEQAGPPSFLSRAQQVFPSYSWQVIYAPVFASLGAFTFFFLWCNYKSRVYRIALILAFSLLGMALILDFIEGLEPEHHLNLYTYLTTKYKMNVYTITHFREMAYETCRHYSKSLEEFMEMLAMTVLWSTFMGHLGRRTPSITLNISDPET